MNTQSQVYKIIENDPSDEMGHRHAVNMEGKYIGLPDYAQMLLDKYDIHPEAVNDNNVCSIGFSPRDNKWYGWSHRALYGFEVGSKVKKGDCAYTPTDDQDAIEDGIRFWTCESHSKPICDGKIHDDGEGRRYFNLTATYISGDKEKLPNESLWGKPWTMNHYLPEEFGNGEWTAASMDDAKQMAIDFANGVS